MSVVTPLAKDKAASELHGIYDTLSKKFGKMPNIFGLMAHRPDVLGKFLPFYSAVMEGGTVEPRYKELAYLKTALINGCEYWTRAHTASAKRIGITEEQIRALLFYERSPLFDEKEKAVILHAERVTRGASAIREASLTEVRKFFDDGQIVELTLVICAANFTNRFNDALRAVPDLGSWAVHSNKVIEVRWGSCFCGSAVTVRDSNQRQGSVLTNWTTSPQTWTSNRQL